MQRDSRLYRYFVAVAEDLSFTAAAARLNLAQPWLSARIRQLEAHLGLALFARTTKRVELTEAGQTLLPKAREVIEAMARFDEAAGLLRRAPEALRIGTPPYAGQIAITRTLFEAFRRDHPATEVDIDVGWSHALVQRALAGEYDAVFALGCENAPGMEAIELDQVALELDMTTADPLASLAPLTPADLAGRLIVVFPRPSNPHLFELLYGEIEAAGARLVEEPGVLSISQLEQRLGPDLVVGRPLTAAARPPRAGRVHRRVEGIAPVAYQLLRPRGRTRAATEAFWSLARSLAPAC